MCLKISVFIFLFRFWFKHIYLEFGITFRRPEAAEK